MPYLTSIVLACLCLSSAAAPAAPAAFIPLSKFARTHGFKDLKVRDKNIHMSCRFYSLALEGNSRRAIYNGTVIWLNQPITRYKGEWAVSAKDADKVLLPLIFPHRGLIAAGRRVIVLDAGHGGKDKGAVSPRQVEEKRVTLYLARKVRDILRRQGIQVRLTRDGDRYLSLEERCRMAERWDADLFISIHMNAAKSTEAKGVEIHILPPAGSPITAQSKVKASDRLAYAGNRYDLANTYLGYVLQRQLVRRSGAVDRGVRRSRFYVIRNVPCPAALVECGFITNPTEENKIISRDYRDKLAQGIADGIAEYLEAVNNAHRMLR